LAAQGLGQFAVQDVYQGLFPTIERGRVKYLRVVEEVPPTLEPLDCGQYRSDHEPFADFYATPVHLVHGPPRSYHTRTQNALQSHAFRAGHAAPANNGSIQVTETHGWPSFVAKASLGTVPVAEDGSAHFLAPAGKVLYFQVLDADYNELQRMRSVVQLQPGEQRSCVGCHDNRRTAPPPRMGTALLAPPRPLDPPPWDPGPFDYQRIVQPVLDQRCVECHDGRPSAAPDLRGHRDAARVPISYRSLISGGWVHYFDWVYGARHFKAEPLSFGTLQSPLFTALQSDTHRKVALEPDELRALKEWIDLNCPLWPDYQFRPDRPE
jgi:mono/diheme cytochrome c family protein